jgi:hypothetical protein
LDPFFASSYISGLIYAVFDEKQLFWPYFGVFWAIFTLYGIIYHSYSYRYRGIFGCTLAAKNALKRNFSCLLGPYFTILAIFCLFYIKSGHLGLIYPILTTKSTFWASNPRFEGHFGIFDPKSGPRDQILGIWDPKSGFWDPKSEI